MKAEGRGGNDERDENGERTDAKLRVTKHRKGSQAVLIWPRWREMRAERRDRSQQINFIRRKLADGTPFAQLSAEPFAANRNYGRSLRYCCHYCRWASNHENLEQSIELILHSSGPAMAIDKQVHRSEEKQMVSC